MSTVFNVLLRINQLMKKVKPNRPDPYKVERARFALMRDQETRGLTRFHDVVPEEKETDKYYY